MRVSSNRQFMGIFCLHALTLALILLTLILTSCSSAAQPTGYVWADRDTLVSLSWNNQSRQLSGVWTDVSYAATVFPVSTGPDVTTVEYIGAVTASGAVILAFHEGTFIETITGNLSSNGQALRLTGIDPASG